MSSITARTTRTTSAKLPTATAVPWSTLVILFTAFSCFKVLLMPSYRSTDFDVHRNWLAITRHLPLKEWYYDDANGTTLHTLDYPPSFAFWEYFLANTVAPAITHFLLPDNNNNNKLVVDERCLELLADTDNTPSESCVIFHRSTVILSDVVLWWGAWVASRAMVVRSGGSGGPQQRRRRQQQLYTGAVIPTSFLLIVFHPGLLWLDHVHFQYNGMLFGLLLASLGYLMQGNNIHHQQHSGMNTTTRKEQRSFHTSHWKAAVLFAFLLTMKHLFLTLAPFYFVYLLRRYCFEESGTTNRSSITRTSLKLQPLRLVTLGMYTATTLMVPFLPFLKQLPQLVVRLFPFGRGLVHDYWAANVWALYTFADKIMGLILGNSSPDLLPDVPASACALLVLLSLLPGLYYGAWMAAAQKDNTRLIAAVVYSALSSFQLGFHVHEKAVLNAIIPLALLATVVNPSLPPPPATNTAAGSTSTCKEEVNDGATSTSHPDSIASFRILFLQMTAFGLLGIFPLLFRVVELPIKLTSYLAYMSLCYHVLMERDGTVAQYKTGIRIKLELLPAAAMIVAIIAILELVPTHVFGTLEFLPLLCTSVGCAVGLVFCWIRLLWSIVKR